jgi:hypothetical protein
MSYDRVDLYVSARICAGNLKFIRPHQRVISRIELHENRILHLFIIWIGLRSTKIKILIKVLKLSKFSFTVDALCVVDWHKQWFLLHFYILLIHYHTVCGVMECQTIFSTWDESKEIVLLVMLEDHLLVLKNAWWDVDVFYPWDFLSITCLLIFWDDIKDNNSVNLSTESIL